MQGQPAEQKLYIFNNQEIQQKWNATASLYQRYDTCMQTGYYTLTSMLKLPEAKHILEVACGTGRLIPYALALKAQQSTYLATDLSSEMIAITQQYLRDHISKMGVELPFEEWTERQKLSFMVHNGEQQLSLPIKFDRIICNFVFHLTESPQKMLASLNQAAKTGCLLGVAVNGNIDQSNMLAAVRQAKKELNIPQTVRSYAFLFNKFGEMAEKAGWEVLLCWDQIMPFVFLEIDQSLEDYLRHIFKLPEDLIEKVKEKLRIQIKQKNAIKLSAQLYICRKK